MALSANLQSLQILQSQPALQNVQIVDLSEKPAVAKVVREGYQVPTPVLDNKNTDFFLGQLVDVVPRQLPRVVGQSIAPGTRVARGTVVDLVLVPKSSIPFTIFQNPHADLQNRTLNLVDPIVENADLRQILLSNDTPDTLTTAQKDTLTAAFTANNITVSATDPARSFDRAYAGVQGAVAFR